MAFVVCLIFVLHHMESHFTNHFPPHHHPSPHHHHQHHYIHPPHPPPPPDKECRGTLGGLRPACAESFWLITDWHKGPGLLLLLLHHHLDDGHIDGDHHHHGNDVCTCLCVLFCSQSPGRYITVTVSLYCWHLDNPATSSHTYNACHTSPNTYFDMCPYTEHTQIKMLLK